MSDDEIVFIDDIGDLSQTPVQQGPPQPKQRLHDLVTLFSGDCLETMRQIGDDCIDAVVTDPPYHLQSIVKRFGSSAAAPPLDYEGGTGVYKRASAGFMGKCYHPATDIMTLNGWKVIADIRVGDTVATLDPQTRSLCWQRVDQTHSYEYNGNLIHVRHRSAEQLVTPNHHVVVDRQQNVEFIEAKDLPRTFHLIAQSTPYPGRSDDVIIYSERQFGYNKGIIKESETYLAKPFFRMFGSWLGDGFVVQRKDDHPANDFFGFSVKKLRKIEAIRHNLTELGIKFTESPGTDNTVFYCYDFVLLGFLKTLGKALTKHIPEWVFEWDASCLEELYRGLIDTDGTRQGDDDQELYFTSSPRLADDFQRLCLQTGRSAISIFKPGGKELVIDGNSCISSDAWTLSVLKPNKRMYCERDARRDRPTIPAVIPVPYHGDVYCIGVPQRHIIYTRFNGKPVWSGNSWDGGDISFQPALWAEVFRILKPGGHILVMGGTRTFHRVVCAIEDAGFEIRDTLMWVTGQGFPKSRNISKDIDKAAGAKRKVVGIAKGKGGENLNQLARVNGNDSDSAKGCGAYGQGAKQVTIDIPVTAPATPEAMQWNGWGTALKPAHEMICLARKPLSEKTVAANVLMWGTGALNIDGCRVSGNVDEMRGRSGVAAKGNEIFGSGIRNPTDEIWEPSQDGRWPPNLIVSVPENEYELRSSVTSEEKRELFRWLSENS